AGGGGARERVESPRAARADVARGECRLGEVERVRTIVADARLGVGEDRAQQVAAVAVAELLLPRLRELRLRELEIVRVPPRSADQLRGQRRRELAVVGNQRAPRLEDRDRLPVSVRALE